jgi:hypothetical protein
MKTLPFTDLIQLIDEPNRTACLTIYADNKERFDKAQGSLAKHQAWTGGYVDHLEEAMNFGLSLFDLMNESRPLPFTVSDILLVLFLHDLEKPFRYIDPKIEFKSDVEKHEFIEGKIHDYGMVLTDDHKNALEFIHGEGDSYSRTERVQKPLAAFVHMCDVASARIWFDYPKKTL